MEWLLILAVLACPLMHFWMMRSHGKKEEGSKHTEHKEHKEKEECCH